MLCYLGSNPSRDSFSFRSCHCRRGCEGKTPLSFFLYDWIQVLSTYIWSKTCIFTTKDRSMWALYWECETLSAKGERNCTIMNLFERAKDKTSPNTTNINPKKRTTASPPSFSRTQHAPPSPKKRADNERTRKNVICDNILKKSDAVPNEKKREQRER